MANEKNDKLSFKERFCWGLGTGGNNMYTTLVGTYLTGYYTDTAGIAVAAVGTMMLLSRFFDGVTDLFMGAIVDKTNTRWGKARPWVFISGPLFALLMFLMLAVPQGWQDNLKLVYAYVTYILLCCFINTIYFVAHNALLARMTLNPDERIKATSMSQIVSSITTLIATVIVNGLITTLGWAAGGLILGIIICIINFIEFFGTKERIDEIEPEEEAETKRDTVPLKQSIPALLKNKYFYLLTIAMILIYIANQGAQTATYYYVTIILGDLNWITYMMFCASVAMFIINLVNPKLVAKFSKRTVAIIGALVNGIGFLVVGIFGNGVAPIVISSLLRGAGVGIMFPCIMAFTADVVDYGEWKQGIRSEGLINSCASMGNKIGVGLGAALVAWILAFGGYDGTAEVQTASALGAINFSFVWMSVILTVVMVIMFALLDVEKHKKEMLTELEIRHGYAEKEA